ncbi:hypothetical protein PAAL109150_09985 [Paenibacillus alkaliterrae]
MPIIEHEGEKYLQVMAHSAVRPYGNDRLKVLTFEEDGTVQCKSRTVPHRLFDAVASIYERNV